MNPSFFWCLNWMNRRWQKRCTQLILGGRPVPTSNRPRISIWSMRRPRAILHHLLTDWRTFFYICIHLNHITSCNPLLNTILIVMGHVISHVIQYSKNMMLFSRPVSYTKIPPVYIPTSITPCTISRHYYNLKIPGIHNITGCSFRRFLLSYFYHRRPLLHFVSTRMDVHGPPTFHQTNR